MCPAPDRAAHLNGCGPRGNETETPVAKTNVTYDSAGIPLAGHLYTPDDSHTGPRPAIVVGHPGSGVKEQAS